MPFVRFVTRHFILGAVGGLAALATPHVAAAQSVEQFYKGSQIKLTVGFGPGGGYTVWAQTIARHIGRHIPGNPGVIVQNMPGAGSLKAANYMYSIAAKDGREIGAFARDNISASFMKAPGVSFDAAKFNWLGTPATETNLCAAMDSSGIASFKDIQAKEVPTGSDGLGTGSYIYPTVVNAMLGSKFKVVTGYHDTGEIFLAMERGEMAATCQSAETFKRAMPEAWASGRLKLLFQGALKANPEFAHVPFVLDLATTKEQRQALEFVYSGQTFGRPYAAPPGVPDDRLAALRKAFASVMDDEQFKADAAKQKLTIDPVLADEMTGMVQALAATPQEVIAKVTAAIGKTE